jgi:RNA polymerase sigma factor (sigma-70 family)
MDESAATLVVTGLFDRWYTQLIRYVVSATGSPDIAEDLVQDVFMQLYQILRSSKEIEHPKAWTLCVLRRAMLRQMQERSRFEQLDEVEITQNRFHESTDGFDVQHLLRALSPREQEVLLLRLEAMKYREIADRLGISMTSVNTLLARALQKLNKTVSAKQPMRERRERDEKKPVQRAS